MNTLTLRPANWTKAPKKAQPITVAAPTFRSKKIEEDERKLYLVPNSSTPKKNAGAEEPKAKTSKNDTERDKLVAEMLTTAHEGFRDPYDLSNFEEDEEGKPFFLDKSAKQLAAEEFARMKSEKKAVFGVVTRMATNLIKSEFNFSMPFGNGSVTEQKISPAMNAKSESVKSKDKRGAQSANKQSKPNFNFSIPPFPPFGSRASQTFSPALNEKSNNVKDEKGEFKFSVPADKITENNTSDSK
ncbi:hypothetical protein G7Y89_g15562 [Cudoniella acicularis]|uniref:Uncharacterized protein n=1 Tax=Cudoniella acicularis TaxID=354080 RepID=A0A8H4QL38_9HELO|nr:hypothetical protein G7Y89_g15562 [Cudoniella acicularis]